MSTERHDHTAERRARIRRIKRLLRFLPRRAVFHRYPVVGRFAAAARKRAYLWSFKFEHVRPALYLGSVLSLWPVIGLQVPLAFVCAVALRANFMVAGALQLITNPFTAAPVYYLTYRVGQFVLLQLGWRREGAPDAGDDGLANAEDSVTIELAPLADLPGDLHWTEVFGSTLAALFIGGTLCGLVLAVVLDMACRPLFALRARHRRVPPGGEI